MNNKKIKKINKFTSLFFGLLIIACTIFSNSSIWAVNEPDYTGFELELYAYSSNIDNGTTSTDTISYNISNENFNGFYKFQINYINQTTTQTYNPGEIKIKLNNPATYLFNYKDFVISADKKTDTNKQYEFSYEYIEPVFNKETKGFENGYFIFTNNNTIEQGEAFTGSIQVNVPFDSYDVINNNGFNTFASIGNIETDPINISFNLTKRPYNLSITTEKIKGYSGLGENADDYIWVKTKLNAQREGGLMNVKEDEAKIKIPINDPNIIVKGSREEAPAIKNGDAYYLNALYYTAISYQSNADYFFIGYPKETYANQTISQEFEFLGLYNDMYIQYTSSSNYNVFDYDYSNLEQISTLTQSFNLSNYEFNHSGELYGIDIQTHNNEGNISYNRLTVEGAVSNFLLKIVPSLKYTGTKYNARFGVDALAISDTFESKMIPEDNYYFSNIELSTLYNENGFEIEKDKYTCNLYIKRRGQDYQLIETFKYTGRKSFSITQNKDIVGVYIEVLDIEENITPQSSYSLNGLSVRCFINNMKDIPLTGQVHIFALLDVYTIENNEEVYLNTVEDSFYNQFTSRDTILQHDKNTHNRNIQRDYYISRYGEEIVPTNFQITKAYNSDKINNIDKYVATSQKAYIGISGSSSTHEGRVTWFTGYDAYILLPKGVVLESLEGEIKENILDNNSSFKKYSEILRDSISVNIIKNWKNTNQTMIHVLIDCMDHPLMIGDDDTIAALHGDYSFYIDYDLKIPFNSISEYGEVFTTEAWVYYLNNPEYPATFTGDHYGTAIADINDINNNENATERTITNTYTFSIITAVESYQSVQTQLETVYSGITTNTAITTPSSNYYYKLVTRTGLNSITNLRLYNNLETSYNNNEYWQGKFLGIDTSFAESKGYKIKTYYSENPAAGNLYNENGSINTDWKEYIQSKEELYANGLAITFNEQCKTQGRDLDYVEIYYNIDNAIYKLGRWGGDDLANKTIYVPTTDFYLYWRTDGSDCAYYGFSIDSIVPAYVEHNIIWKSQLPYYTPTEIKDAEYPSSANIASYTHGNYGNYVGKVWHYTYTQELPKVQEQQSGTNPDLVKSLVFEFLDNNNNPAIIPKDAFLYVLINMQAPEERLLTYAYNSCRTEWTALDDFGDAIEGIVGIESNITKITTSATFDITVNKIWDDNNNELGFRPENINVILYKEGFEVTRKPITFDNTTVIFEDLPYEDYELYTVGEENNPFYNSSIIYNEETKQYELTNTFNPDSLGSLTGKAIWENDTEQLRPDIITINLLQDGVLYATTTTNKTNNWEYTFNNIPIYKHNGAPHIYSIQENSIENYVIKYPSGTIDVLNYYNRQNITGIKTWENDTPATRPENITIKLLQNNIEITSTTTNANNNWEYTFNSIPIYDSNGQKYNYTVEELPVENYIARYDSPTNGLKIKFNAQSRSEAISYDYIDIFYKLDNQFYKLGRYGGTALSNLELEVPSIDFYLYWHTDNIECAYYGFSIDSIEPIFVEVPTNITPTTEKTWQNYTAEEISNDTYPDSNWDGDHPHGNYKNNVNKVWHYTGTSSTGCNITNVYTFKNIQGTAIWENDSEQDRPETITVNLLQDGIKIDEITINAENNWEFTFENLPVFKDDGTEHIYSVSGGLADNYVTSYPEQTFNIINHLNFKNITGTKTWKNDTPSNRPESITIKLLQDGIEYMTTTTTANNNWNYSFENIPIYKEDGSQYLYSVEEQAITGYSTFYSRDNTKNGLSITFNEQFKTENVNYDYLEIYYILEGTTYKLGRWGGTSLAGTTIQVPTTDFYLYWKTDGSASNYYGFSIDSIQPANVTHSSTTNEGTLPSYTIEEISGNSYPDSAFDSYTHGSYGNNVNKLWHYNFNSNTPFENAFNIINIKNIHDIEIKKQDFFSHEGLANIAFDLYEYTCNQLHDCKNPGDNECWTKINTFTTNENGLLKLEDITIKNVFSNSIFGLIENCPDNYSLPQGIYWEITIDKDFNLSFETKGNSYNISKFTKQYRWLNYDLNIQNINNEYVLYNIKPLVSVEITKQIKVSDINYYNGIPTFLFKLTGIDGSNTERTYYKQMQFTQEYVAENTDSNGYVSITEVFENLINIDYTLSEEIVSRYEVDSISNVEGGIVDGSTVIFNFDDTLLGKATFINKKYEKGLFSHNDFKINTISNTDTVKTITISSETPIIETITTNYFELYKVSNYYIEYEELLEQYFNIKIKNLDCFTYYPIIQDETLYTETEGLYIVCDYVAIVTQPTLIEETILSPGIYTLVDLTNPESEEYINIISIGEPLTPSVTDYSREIYFSINTEGTQIGEYYKISDTPLTYDEMMNSLILEQYGYEKLMKPANMEIRILSDNAYRLVNCFINIIEDSTIDGEFYPAGIYSVYPPEAMADDTNILYVPANINLNPEYEFKVSVTSQTEATEIVNDAAKISNNYLSFEQLMTAFLYYRSGDYMGIQPCAEIAYKMTDCVFFANYFIFVTEDTTLDGFSLTAGTYCINPEHLSDDEYYAIILP